ncbi:MAG: NYN domain-containing protein [Frankiaceae bacterium]
MTAPDELPGPAAHEPAEDGAEGGSVVLAEAVRGRVLALAAEALGALPPEEVPAALRTFARFTPGKRARLAAVPLAGALEADPVFRQRVAERVRAALPDVATALQAGSPPSAAPPADLAALAYLLRPSGWREQVSAATAAAEREAAAAQAAKQAVADRRRADELRTARTAARADVDRLRGDVERLRRDNDELRQRLGQARERARRAESELGDAARAAEAAAAAAESRAVTAESELRRLRTRLSDAEAAVEAARRAAREGRSTADTRLWLLLDTLVNAAQGLRRELALPPPTSRPADLVGDDRDADPFAGVGSRALAADDPATLDQLLGLPGVHLVVDGYNVTKSGYGGLSLENQRARLLTGLAALAARTGCEVTCVFDGAALDTPLTTGMPRGVRVRFSAAGETADEVIRRLVRAEPPGRPVVVVSSDREVADGVRRAGARALPAAALLRRLDRG